MELRFTQPQLISALLIWLDEHGVAEIDPRQLKAIIHAADEIIAALRTPPATSGEG